MDTHIFIMKWMVGIEIVLFKFWMFKLLQKLMEHRRDRWKGKEKTWPGSKSTLARTLNVQNKVCSFRTTQRNTGTTKVAYKSHSLTAITIKTRISAPGSVAMSRVSANSSPSRSLSVASTFRAYTLPIILFAGAMYYQLFVIPNAFPRSHYDGNSFFINQSIYLFIAKLIFYFCMFGDCSFANWEL